MKIYDQRSPHSPVEELCPNIGHDSVVHTRSFIPQNTQHYHRSTFVYSLSWKRTCQCPFRLPACEKAKGGDPTGSREDNELSCFPSIKHSQSQDSPRAHRYQSRAYSDRDKFSHLTTCCNLSSRNIPMLLQHLTILLCPHAPP